MAETRRMRPLLGTFVEVGIRGPASADAVDTAFGAIEQAQAWWSFHDPDSELSRLNGSATHRVVLNAHTLRLLRTARALMRASGGAFDCTVGGELVLRGALPDHGADADAALPRGSADDIEIGPGWARLRRPLRLTLDGIAKGYAVDLAIRALRRRGAAGGWVNAGGDLRVFGDLALPVQRRELDGRFTPLGVLRNAALASSLASPGDSPAPGNEAFPAHIIAPVGRSPSPGIWTVLAHCAWRADALTKVAATASAAQRKALVQRLGGSLVVTEALP